MQIGAEPRYVMGRSEYRQRGQTGGEQPQVAPPGVGCTAGRFHFDGGPSLGVDQPGQRHRRKLLAELDDCRFEDLRQVRDRVELFARRALLQLAPPAAVVFDLGHYHQAKVLVEAGGASGDCTN